MMGIGQSTVGPKTFHSVLILSKYRKRGRKRGMLTSLMLTPMVDMFSLLVIFLLQVFSASPQTIVATPGIELPRAGSVSALKDAPVLSLTRNEAFLDKLRIGSVEEVLRKPDSLLRRLDAFRVQWLHDHPGTPFPGEISLEAHQDLPSTIIARYLALLPSQQFGSIQLVTLAEGGKR